MRIQSTFNKKGVTLIELLVVLVILALTLGGIYRVFISQAKTYAAQDQVVEVQQSVRSAMDIILRDLRMTGFVSDNPASKETIANPIATPLQTNSITVSYVYYDKTFAEYQTHQVTYSVDGSSNLIRTQTITVNGVVKPPGVQSEIILPNVTALTFTYGIDANNDGVMDDQNGDGIIDDGDYVAAGAVGTAKVVAIRVVLTGSADPTNLDITKVVSPRTLVSAVTPRNLCLRY